MIAMRTNSFALLAAKKANISAEKLVQIKESVANRTQASPQNREFFAKNEVRMAGCAGCAGGNCAACMGKSCEAQPKDENVLMHPPEVLFLAQKLAEESEEELLKKTHAIHWQEKIIGVIEKKDEEAAHAGEYAVMYEPVQAAKIGGKCTAYGALANQSFERWLLQIYGLETENEPWLPRWMPFARSYYWAEEQRKKERAKLKELGNRASAEEKRRLEALEEEIRRKKTALDALMIKNLENALSILECPSAHGKIISPRVS